MGGSSQTPTGLGADVVGHVFDGLQQQPGTGSGRHRRLPALVALLLLLQGLRAESRVVNHHNNAAIMCRRA